MGWAVATASIAGMSLFGLGAERCANSSGTVQSVARVNDAGVLQIGGDLNAAIVQAVERAVGKADRPVTGIQVASRGGQTWAMNRIAVALAPLGVRIEVPDGKTCQSACVGLLASNPAGFDVAPTATLMFHAAADRFGLASDGPCGRFNDAWVWVQLRARSVAGALRVDPDPAMLPWAAHISPQLPKLFALCPTDPLGKTNGPRAQAAHQQASLMVEQIKRRLDGRPLKPFAYRDFGSLVSLGRYSTVGNLMGFAVGRSLFIEGYLARMMYRSLYAMHQSALHGTRSTVLRMIGNTLARRPDPGVKLH